MKTRKILLAALPVLLLLAAAAAYFAGSWYIDRYRPNFTRDYVLYVYPDSSPESVRDSIVRGAAPRSLRSLDRMLRLGWQTPQTLALSGTIRSRERVVKLISRQMMVDSTTVDNALRDNDFLAKYGVDSTDFFTIILPDNYQLWWTATIDEIFARLRSEYDAFWTEERVEKARLQGLTPYEVSILASIVQGETRREEEYPVIAAVYLNRLHRGMKLQADPTICYIYGYTLNRVLRKHLEAESPYNTYKYAGLPPTPINAPSKACLEAVLNPDSHDYIFFCASPAFDGSHRFAVSYSEHMKNAREFQRALNARNRR